MMRVVSIYFICAALMFSITAAYSAPVGSTATPALLKSSMISKNNDETVVGVMFGFEADNINDRKLKDESEKSGFSFYNTKLGLLFADKALIYGMAGAGKLEAKLRNQGSEFQMKSETGSAWGVGGNIVLYELALYHTDNSILRLGVDGKYRSTQLGADKVIIGSRRYDLLPHADVVDPQMEYRDWQVAGAVSWQWKRLIPYAGVKYSDAAGKMHVIVSGTRYEQDLKSDNNIGVFFGSDVLIKDPISEADCISLNIEYRLMDEEALSVGLAIRF